MFIGLIFILIGTLFLISIIAPEFNIDFSYLIPLVLMASSLYYIIKGKKFTLANTTVLYIGIWFLLERLNIIKDPLDNAFFPILLIIIGIFIVIESLKVKKVFKRKDNNLKNYYGIFSGLEERITDTNFKGANIYSIFGGVDLDLRGLELKEDITINAYSIFGGTSIFVNDNFKVKFNSFSLFGGNENKSITTDKKKVSTLTINCISIFGGTDVK